MEVLLAYGVAGEGCGAAGPVESAARARQLLFVACPGPEGDQLLAAVHASSGRVAWRFELPRPPPPPPAWGRSPWTGGRAGLKHGLKHGLQHGPAGLTLGRKASGVSARALGIDRCILWLEDQRAVRER